MGVNIVKGLAGKVEGSVSSSSSQQRNSARNAITPGNGSAASAAARAVASDAAPVSIKTRGSVATEKIRDSQEANKVAKGVADKILDDERSVDVHSELGSISARDYF